MVELIGYIIGKEIYSGIRTVVYRGIREEDQMPVVIKLLRREYPDFHELVKFRNQYSITKNLNITGVIKTYSLEKYQNSYALIMEDFGGISLLEEMRKRKHWELEEFLDIAIQIVSALAGLYQNRVIHKDIKPANILINTTTLEVKLTDFSIASLLETENQPLSNTNILEGTLAYLSPEQTGRINRLVDYRTDFYSLGVTFFELLTGQLPFTSDDPMDLIYYHIAKHPPSIENLNPNIPTTISNIISKLMAKNAEDRYQTTYGLKYDLEKCLDAWRKKGHIDNFELGQKDISEHLQWGETHRLILSEKLYGREKEVEILLTSFQRVCAAAAEMTLVAGFSGIGKTALVNEVHKPIIQARGYFIKGKFDQFGRNIPFSAFVQAFRELMTQLLSENDRQLQKWKMHILTALGENAQILINVIPELEKIIGKQPPVVELLGTAAENRFNLLWEKFIQIFATIDHPLVIFLDDLQWADLASLKLIHLLMSNTDTSYLLLIGAYRDNEVSPAHPLMLTIKEIRQLGAIVNSITLTPLQQSNLNQLIIDNLKLPSRLSHLLTNLVYQKTQGNPFFINQFIKFLYTEGLINFNSNNGYWQCDIVQVKSLAITDNVVEFIVLKLQKLPLETQAVLQKAACIGNQFDLFTLAIVNEKSQSETASHMWTAILAGIVIPQSEIYKFFQDESITSQISEVTHYEQYKFIYKFLHDQVQQAAYSLIPENQKNSTHLKIGQLLLRNIPSEKREEHIFDIVNHLNMGMNLITEQSERNQLAQLNLIAGKKAKIATAYAATVKYLNTGIDLLAINSWATDYDLTLSLYVEAIEAAYLNTDFIEIEQLTDTVLKNAKVVLDTVPVYIANIRACSAQNRLLLGVQTALTILKQLGLEFPENPSVEDIMQEAKKTQLTLMGRKPSELINLPKMTNPHYLAVLSILSSVFSAVRVTNPKISLLFIFKQVQLSIQYGNTPLSSLAYASYGAALINLIGDINTGYEFAQLSLNLLSQFDVKEMKVKTISFINSFIVHWKEHLRNTLEVLLAGYQSGWETGDLEGSAWCIFLYFCYSYCTGKELSDLEQELTIYIKAFAQLKQTTPLYYLQTYNQAVLYFLGHSENILQLKGEIYDEDIMLPIHQQANDRAAIYHLHINKVILCYFFEEYTHSLENADIAAQYIDAIPGTYMNVILPFYDSLNRLALYNYQETTTQNYFLNKVQENQKKLKKWADYAPMNYLHKFYLVEAELCRILGQTLEAIDYYDLAIQGAKKNEYAQEEALSNELAAKFYIGSKKDKIAQVYLIDAYYAYIRWGAKAKVNDLEKKYPDLLASIIKRNNTEIVTHLVNNSLSIQNTIQSPIPSSINMEESLELAALIKASQAIASEIKLEKLISKLMQVVIENLYAKKAAFILIKDDHLFIEATAIFGQETMIKSIPIEDSQEVPITLINYVSHTQETLVIDNVINQPQFAADPYIISKQPKSLLCTSIINQGKLVAILYLENNLTAGSFTKNRLDIVKILCSQIAISLENARLYQQSQDYTEKLEKSLENFQEMQLQLVQNEKMSALGNLIAGVAHEINNPIGFIGGNIQPAVEYIWDLLGLIELYQQKFPNPGVEIEQEIQNIELEYLREDLPQLLASMKEGVQRIRNISNSLLTFSRADTNTKTLFNIHDGINSTVLILKHRLKILQLHGAIKIVRDYGDLPLVNCFPGQLNQVFMNLIANAIDALEESNNIRSEIEMKTHLNQITIHTALSEDNEHVIIKIIDNGIGMSDEVKQKIFEHLFTTKPVGKGTGLGLSIARQIIVEKHGGTLEVNSVLGEGTEFIIKIPK